MANRSKSHYMHTAAAVAAIAAMISQDAARGGPASQPTKAVEWTSILKRLPRDMSPPKGKKWTRAESRAAIEWVAAELQKTGRVSFVSKSFNYTGGGDNKSATASTGTFEQGGATWTLLATCTLTDAADNIGSENRDRETFRVTGDVVQADGSASGSDASKIFIRVSLAETALVRQ